MLRRTLPPLVAVWLISSAVPADAGQIWVAIASPAPGALVGTSVWVEAVTQGPVTSVAVDVSIDAGTTWMRAGVDTEPADGWVVEWVPGPYEGPAILRASAVAGTEHTEASIEVQVDGVPPEIAIRLTRPVFSPNGDGSKDTTTISITGSEPLALDVHIVDATGATVRTLAAGIEAFPPATRLGWQGRDDDRRLLPDGAYTLLAHATDAAGNPVDAEALATIDTRRPSYRWRDIRPEPVRREQARVTFAFRVRDAGSPMRVRFAVTNVTGAVVAKSPWSPAPVGAGERTFDLLTRRGRRIPPGLYRTVFRVRDEAGNERVTHPRAWRDHHPVRTQVLRRVERARGMVALTFDDCNDPVAWARILDITQARGSGASFFCRGSNVRANPALARRTVRSGATIGSHGWDHRNLRTLTRDEQRRRFELDAAAWWATAGATSVPFVRPPYGEYNTDTLVAAGSAGYAWLAMWDVDPRDWTHPGAAAIATRVLAGARSGSIVVLHVQAQTADALPAILQGLRARGLRAVTMDEMLAA